MNSFLFSDIVKFNYFLLFVFLIKKKTPFLTKLLINLEPIILVITTNNDADDDNSSDDKICIFTDFFILIVFKSQQLMNSVFCYLFIKI